MLRLVVSRELASSQVKSQDHPLGGDGHCAAEVLLTGSQDDFAVLWLIEEDGPGSLKVSEKFRLAGHTDTVSQAGLVRYRASCSDASALATSLGLVDAPCRPWEGVRLACERPREARRLIPKYRGGAAACRPEERSATARLLRCTVAEHRSTYREVGIISCLRCFRGGSCHAMVALLRSTSVVRGLLGLAFRPLNPRRPHRRARLENTQRLHRFRCRRRPEASFSNDGKYVATASYDGTVKIWAPESGALLHTLDGPSKEVCGPPTRREWEEASSQRHTCGEEGTLEPPASHARELTARPTTCLFEARPPSRDLYARDWLVVSLIAAC